MIDRNSIIAGICLILLGCGAEPPEKQDAPVVMFSMPVLELIARPMLPDGVSTKVLLPEGASPHGFEPPPSSIVELNRTSLLILAHPMVDGWAARLGSPRTFFLWGHDGQIEHEHGHSLEENVHYWPDPLRVQESISALSDEFCRSFPSDCPGIRERATELASRIDSTISLISERTRSIGGRPILSSHPFFDLFLTRFNLNAAGAIRELPGQDPRPASLANLLATVSTSNPYGILVERTADNRATSLLANDLDIPMIEMDPLGHQANSYEEYLLNAADALTTNYRPND